MSFIHITLKEIKELTRDKKSLIFNILFPLLIIIFISITSALLGNYSKKKSDKITIGINSLYIKEQLGDSNTYYEFVEKSQEDIEDDIKNEKISLGVIFDESKESVIFFQNSATKDDPYMEALKDDILSNIKIILLGNINLPSVQSIIEYRDKDYNKIIYNVIGVICSYIIILLSMRINNSNAYYLSTKEKASGTIQIVLSSPLSKMQIILGKWLSNLISCFSIAIVIFLPIYFVFTMLFKVFLKVDLDLVSKIPLLIFNILGFCTVFSLAQITFGLIAKSVKQAQVYLVYLPWVLLCPMTIIFGMDINTLNSYRSALGWFDFIPIVNFYDLIQMSIRYDFNIYKIGVILISNIIAIFVFIVILLRAFESEDMLYFTD
ncbi:ABC transporter permease subunit [Clostridium frigidicarnis]|uniref:ABC-type Na+ efflux pump, permease component n=1 Tax=Clostridium frigidicarnis TaxID=84698 RepID=A0A1I0ZYH0_9CLOT|nr:ABC transporter permease subunit [Clostridium frigidicarnis]SFB30671.1 ABC-type Na+ efflux pump, permease component [Clostridium frigidicarnis]